MKKKVKQKSTTGVGDNLTPDYMDKEENNNCETIPEHNGPLQSGPRLLMRFGESDGLPHDVSGICLYWESYCARDG